MVLGGYLAVPSAPAGARAGMSVSVSGHSGAIQTWSFTRRSLIISGGSGTADNPCFFTLECAFSRVVLSVSMVRGKIAASEDFKRLGAESKLLIHSLVVGAGHERYTNFKDDCLWISGDVPLTKCLTANPVRPASALFKHGRIPGKIVVDHVTAVAMEVNTLLSDLGADEHLREQWRVKAIEDTVSGCT